MDEQLHIIIAGDKGKVFKLPCSRKKICVILAGSAVGLFILTVASIFSFSLYTQNCTISEKLANMQEKLQKSTQIIAQHNKLNQEVARLEQNNVKQAAAFQEEKDSLISTALDELNERSELIEKIIANIGVKLPKTKDNNSKHKGGPFIQQPDSKKDEILFKADKNLNTIRYLPLGKPVKGSISSGFGKRKDPKNHKSAFHTGIDFRGERGEPVYATADGVVRNAFRNGGYGNYILIDHGNGYTSSFSHLQKYMVHKGDRVERGQIVGMIGNTGRSTGSHLHYEIALGNKPINPYKFLKVANLAQNAPLKKNH